MNSENPNNNLYDIFIVGGGVNGCGIARDAAGRGLSVCLAEMNDIGGATSSASTKLFHGGLRYLEYFEINLVRHALKERETLLRAMPHISWPMRFILPYHDSMRFENTTPTSRLLQKVMPWLKGRRPAWLIRVGLFMYDHLGGRKILPGTKSISLVDTPEGNPLHDKYKHAYEYSDCWVEDSRLVVLNAQDAQQRGASILVRTEVVSATRIENHWEVTLKDKSTGAQKTVTARVLVNAAGPWVGQMIQNRVRLNSSENVRLVRGSHIVTKKLFDHDKSYLFQGSDGRIIFAIPYETDFTLLGTTDAEHEDPDTKPECAPEETQYLLDFANEYFKQNLVAQDVVWSYSGVRPLYDDGAASASAATREYVISVDKADGAPMMNIFGGKITTYRCLAEDVLEKIAENITGIPPKTWTAGASLPGGDFPVDGVDNLVQQLVSSHEFIDALWAARLVKAYGTQAKEVVVGSVAASDLGENFGANLTEAEVKWLMNHEFARTAEDVVWRRSKLGLRLSVEQIAHLDQWMLSALAEKAA